MSSQTRPDMVQVTFEVPDRLVGRVYIAIGAVLQDARGPGAVEEEAGELREWGTEALDAELARTAWRKFSPRAQAVFSLLMDNPGVAMPPDEISAKVGLANGRHGLAGVVAWPSRQCADMGLTAPFRFDYPAAPGETGSYWMDPQTAQLFIMARDEALATQAGTEPQS